MAIESDTDSFLLQVMAMLLCSAGFLSVTFFLLLAGDAVLRRKGRREERGRERLELERRADKRR